jgi:hypothetical protein
MQLVGSSEVASVAGGCIIGEKCVFVVGGGHTDQKMWPWPHLPPLASPGFLILVLGFPHRYTLKLAASASTLGPDKAGTTGGEWEESLFCTWGHSY